MYKKLLPLITLGICLASFTNAQTVSRIDIRVDTVINPSSCPAVIKFTATIHSSGKGTLKYHWERSDGATDTRSTFITLSGTGTDVVTTTWTLGRSYAGWEKLVVLSPVRASSPEGHFKLECKVKPVQSKVN